MCGSKTSQDSGTGITGSTSATACRAVYQVTNVSVNTQITLKLACPCSEEDAFLCFHLLPDFTATAVNNPVMPVKRQLIPQEIQQAGFWAVVLWPACKLLQTWAPTPVGMHLLPLQYLQAFSVIKNYTRQKYFCYLQLTTV